jgi:hypothetical protein
MANTLLSLSIAAGVLVLAMAAFSGPDTSTHTARTAPITTSAVQ